MSNSTISVGTSNKAYTTGSTRDLIWPIPPPKIWWQSTYVAIAGEDTIFKPFLDCYVPPAVQHPVLHGQKSLEGDGVVLQTVRARYR